MTTPDPVPAVASTPAAGTDWMDGALCAQVDLDIFFPNKGDEGGQLFLARTVCKHCDVREACLEYAMQTGDTFGVYGGMTPNQRRRLARERRRQERAA